jgi:hypothetical protein
VEPFPKPLSWQASVNIEPCQTKKRLEVIALALAFMGCTIAPEATIDLVAGGVTGAFIAGPIGAAVGAGVGVVAAPMVGVVRT